MIYQKFKNYIVFHRVSYGKHTATVELREYRVNGRMLSPVGTKKEIEEWFLTSTLPLTYKGFILVDKYSTEICTF